MRRGWALAAKSWNVIQSDRELLVFPAFSLLATLAAAAVLFGPAALIAARDHSGTPFVVAAFLGAYPFTFIATYFGVAFVGVASRRLAGQETEISDGFDCANTRLALIARWALLATVVGIVISLLERARVGGLAGRILLWLGGTAWSVATFFVIPVIAIEGKGPFDAVKESASLVRKRWGEGVVGSTVINGAFGLLLVPVILIGLIGFKDLHASPGFGAFVLFLAVVLGLAVIVTQAAVDSLFRLVLFDYAVAEMVPHPFALDDVVNGLSPKRRG